MKPDLNNILREAGWKNGRRVDVDVFLPRDCIISESAKEILGEFGGLHMEVCGAGNDFARVTVLTDPRGAEGMGEYFDEIAKKHGMKLSVLGEISNGLGYLMMDEAGKLYAPGERGLRIVGDSFLEGLYNLVTGTRYGR